MSERSMIPVSTNRGLAFQNPFLWAKHRALRGDFVLTPQEWFNVNSRIKKSVDKILPYGYLIQGPGPKTPIKRPCSLADPSVQQKIRAMAENPDHPEFRYTYLNGKVWFSFRIIDLEEARQPLIDDSSQGSQEIDDDTF
ncbi:hypothetical protein NUW58_g1391 [Xylaria curta]|uniref:Uncharacterized protein n=1 Tax=Xylaria curta TaxID=42375 RepID=A0ACC1PKJ3_9PEZI|nr:hypothetical protein NUW58_g1391 [Xylaria curta]